MMMMKMEELVSLLLFWRLLLLELVLAQLQSRLSQFRNINTSYQTILILIVNNLMIRGSKFMHYEKEKEKKKWNREKEKDKEKGKKKKERHTHIKTHSLKHSRTQTQTHTHTRTRTRTRIEEIDR